MIGVNVSSDIKNVIKRLNDLEKKQVPFATALALTNVGKQIKQEERNEMERVFDRPTAYTLNSLYLKKATKRDLTVRVLLKDRVNRGNAANTYLNPQIYTGQRRLKGFEKLLQARGVLPEGYYAVPAKRTKLDRHGNIATRMLTQIIKATKPRSESSTGRRTQLRFIVLDEKPGQAGGIFAMTADQRLYPVLIFVKRAQYGQRLDFYKVAENVYRKNIIKEFEGALIHALRTAR